MINIDAFIMGTCQPQRLEWLEQSLDFLEQQKFPFTKKFLIIEEFDGHTLPQEFSNKFKQLGWDLIVYSGIIDNKKDKSTRATCMLMALEHVESEFIFYNEDDILVRMPDKVDIDSVLSMRDGNRECGMLSMNLGGSNQELSRGQLGDLVDISDNLLLEKESYLVFQRSDSKRGPWFVEFPALFVKTELIKNILEPHFGNGGLEIHMTNKYVNLQLDHSYFKASICKKNIFDVVEFYRHNFNREMLETAKLTRLLDENQGDVFYNLESIPMI